MFYVGIDPGMNGAIAVLDGDGNIYADILPMPIAGKEIDISKLVQKMRNYIELSWYSIACIEKVGAMPGQGVVSMFKFGFVTGILHGVFRTLEIPLYLVTPQAWKKEILAGTDKSKQACIDWCLRTYPNVNLLKTARSYKHHDGMADALAIATYAYRKYSS